jgi:hypothetical protein
MKVALASVPTARAERIRARLVRILAASRWRRPSHWRDAIVLLTPEREEAMHRLAFAAELRADGLEEAAHEAAARHVGPGEVLVYTVQDSARVACVGFLVVDLRGRGSR